MSNHISVDVNKVTNIVSNNSYYEISITDAYNIGSINIEEEQIPKTDIEALRYLKDMGSDVSNEICDILDAILEYKYEITINDTNYEWDEIKHIFDIEED